MRTEVYRSFIVKEIKLYPEKEPNKDCKECFGEGTVFVYFADHRKKRVIQEWVYCDKCYPTSSASFDNLPRDAEDISKEESERLLTEEKYELYVP